MQRKALDTTKKLYGKEHPSVAVVLGNLGTLLLAKVSASRSDFHIYKTLKVYHERVTRRKPYW